MDEITKEEFYRPMYRQPDSSDDEKDSFTEFRTRTFSPAVQKQTSVSESNQIRLQSSPQIQSRTVSSQQQAMASPAPLKDNYISTPDEYHRWLKLSKKRDMIIAKSTRLEGCVLLYWPPSPNSVPGKTRKGSFAGVIEHGGILAKEWDGGSRITHIIVDSSGKGREYRDVLENLKLDCIPSSVQLVTAAWVDDKINPRWVQAPSSEDRFRVSGYTRSSSIDSGKEANQPSKKRESDDVLGGNKAKMSKVQRQISPLPGRSALDIRPDTTIKPHRSPKLMKQQKAVSVGARLGVKVVRSDLAGELKEKNNLDEIMEYVQRARDDQDIRELMMHGGTVDTTVTADGANIDRLLAPLEEFQDVAYDSDMSEEATPLGKAKGFLCARSNVKGSVERGSNAALIKQLKYLAAYYADRKEDAFRAKGYREAISMIRKQEHKIVTKEQALKLRRIGSSIATKIEEFGKHGSIKLVDEIVTSPRQAAIKLFTGIYGVGQRTAEEWYNAGKHSLEHLQDTPLHDHQRIGLDHYDDFNKRIPRDEVSLHAEFVTKIAKEVNEHLEVAVAGSYRRGEVDSGDVDFLITASGSHVNKRRLRLIVFEQLIPALKTAGYIKADLTSASETGSHKWMGAACLPELDPETWRRVDILVVPGAEWGASLLYFTGNDIFNRSMRLLARRSGCSLNHRGLYKGVVRDKNGKKTTPGILIESRDEKKIFEALGVKWRPPHERCP